MNKNTITGFVLIAAVIFGYSWWATPSQQQIAEQMRQDSIANVEKDQQLARENQLKKAKEDLTKQAIDDSTALFHYAFTGEKQDIVLQNEKVAITINTKGASIEKAVVKGFKSNENYITQHKDTTECSDVTLFDNSKPLDNTVKEQSMEFVFNLKESNISTSELYFTPSEVTDNSVVLTTKVAEGKSINIRYSLGDSYILHMSMDAQGMNGLFPANTNLMDVNWQQHCRQQERGHTFENRYSTLTYHFTNGGTDKLNEAGNKTETMEEKTDWIAFKSQFFSMIFIAKNDFQQNATYSSTNENKDSGYLKSYDAKMKTFFDPTGQTPSEFDFYIGPNNFRGLKNIQEQCNFNKDLELERLVYLGWPLFRIINRWFTIYVFDFLTSLAIPMGVVLILITLLLKFITFPMVRKSYMSSAKMRVLKPRLEEATKHLNKEEDQMQRQQVMMQEYQKYGVSPMAGCLPMLIQMPIWIAMFNFVPNAIELRGESFLWIKDLSSFDPILEWSNNLPLIGNHLSLTCILFCAGNLIYTWLSMKQQKDQMMGQQQGMKMMQYMMFFMPVMFFFIFNDYSAGLNFYYFISLFFSAIVMWALRKGTNDKKLLEKLVARYEENKKNPKKLTGLAASLQRMQEQQAAMQKQREELERRYKDLNK